MTGRGLRHESPEKRSHQIRSCGFVVVFFGSNREPLRPPTPPPQPQPTPPLPPFPRTPPPSPSLTARRRRRREEWVEGGEVS